MRIKRRRLKCSQMIASLDFLRRSMCFPLDRTRNLCIFEATRLRPSRVVKLWNWWSAKSNLRLFSGDFAPFIISAAFYIWIQIAKSEIIRRNKKHPKKYQMSPKGEGLEHATPSLSKHECLMLRYKIWFTHFTFHNLQNKVFHENHFHRPSTEKRFSMEDKHMMKT